MDVLKLLEVLEELLYRLALWIILGPKTLYFVLRSPGSINRYVIGELAKPPEDRFADLLSPLIFWGLAALMPTLMVIDLLGTIPGSRVATEAEWMAFVKASFPTRLVLLSVAALAPPLSISIWITRKMGKPISRESLRSPFFVQCYCLAPTYIFLLPFVFDSLRYEDIPETLLEYASITLTGVWFLYAETLVLSEQLAISRSKALIRALALALLVYVALFLLEGVAITIFNGFSYWLKP